MLEVDKNTFEDEVLKADGYVLVDYFGDGCVPCAALHPHIEAFAEKYGIEKVYDQIDDVFADPDVDIIYISTPHNTHIQYLRKALAALPGSLTVFIVSQRAASLQHADQILVLDDGHLVGIGTHDQLRQTCPVYEEIYESQFKKGEAEA